MFNEFLQNIAVVSLFLSVLITYTIWKEFLAKEWLSKTIYVTAYMSGVIILIIYPMEFNHVQEGVSFSFSAYLITTSFYFFRPKFIYIQTAILMTTYASIGFVAYQNPTSYVLLVFVYCSFLMSTYVITQKVKNFYYSYILVNINLVVFFYLWHTIFLERFYITKTQLLFFSATAIILLILITFLRQFVFISTELNMAKVKYQALFHNDEMGVFITDDKFRLSYCNEALRLKKLFLYDEKLVGKDVYELFYTIRVIVTHFEVFDQLRVKIGEKSKDSIQLTYTTITNELVKLHYSPLWNQDVYKGGIWLVYFTEDNAPSESENQFTHIDMDSLIQTEEMFYSMLREIQSSKRKDDVICLIAIDDYSVYKSHYGTLNVKSCKQKISKIIKTELKNRSYGIYRVGDDKLALSIKHIDPHLVAPLLESIQKRIRDERIVHEFATMFPILTVSISVVCSQSLLNERTTGEVEDLLYKYLEQCKKKGGNCYIISPFLYGI